MKLTTRIVLALLLAFGSDIILWPNPLGRALLDWPLHLVGFLALSGVLLDLAARYRVRNLFGLLTLAGIYALSASLLLYPTFVGGNLVTALFSRVLGAQTFVALLMLLTYVQMGSGRGGWRLVLFSLPVGVGWGIWARWSPALIFATPIETPLALLLGYAVGGLVLVLLALLAAARVQAPLALRLSWRGWGLVLLVVAGLLTYRLLQGAVDVVALLVLPLLVIFCWLIMWYLRRKRGSALFETAFPPSLNWPLLIAAAVGLLAAGMVGYWIPAGTAEIDPIDLIGTLLTTFGWVWLPTVSLVLGGQALLRQVRAQQL